MCIMLLSNYFIFTFMYEIKYLKYIFVFNIQFNETNFFESIKNQKMKLE